jgi:hypothetical protein
MKTPKTNPLPRGVNENLAQQTLHYTDENDRNR